LIARSNHYSSRAFSIGDSPGLLDASYTITADIEVPQGGGSYSLRGNCRAILRAQSMNSRPDGLRVRPLSAIASIGRHVVSRTDSTLSLSLSTAIRPYIAPEDLTRAIYKMELPASGACDTHISIVVGCQIVIEPALHAQSGDGAEIDEGVAFDRVQFGIEIARNFLDFRSLFRELAPSRNLTD
jgi:hypothetical protein